MKRNHFVRTGSLWLERTVNREGPVVTWCCWKPHTARMFRDDQRKELLKFIAWPKSTVTGAEVREWIASFDKVEENAPDAAAEVKAVSWGPEVHDAEPNDQTKMIT